MGYNSDAASAAKGGKMMKRAVWALLTIGALTLSASAQIWYEQGDAGDLPETAQSTGSGLLTQIRGSLDVNDVDMYAIYITDPAAFSASTVGGATWDTQLFLFDANGVGVVAEDDTGGLQSTIDNTAGCITAPGLYYLAITRYNKDPLGCNDGDLWFTNDNNCPNGPDSSSRVDIWTGSILTAGSYTIFLTGVAGATAGDPADCRPSFEGWDETANGGGDAGDLPETAQSTGSGALPAIRGTIGAANDVDVYAIYISDPSTFSATTIGGTSLDTALWLFDETGRVWCITMIIPTPPRGSSRASITVPSALRSRVATIWRLAYLVAVRRAATRDSSGTPHRLVQCAAPTVRKAPRV
jgi:hypothetical protein